jgi:carnitine-CoA ligase
LLPIPERNPLNNVATFLRDRAALRPSAQFGLHGDQISLSDLYGRSLTIAHQLRAAGIGPERVSLLVGSNSTEWLITWAALQLAGSPTVLVNPSLPPSLVAEVVQPLNPYAVLCTDEREPEQGIAETWLDASKIARGRLRIQTAAEARNAESVPGVADLPGLSVRPNAICGYMLTSGTSGRPKLVAQSHEYLLTLGRYVADVLCLTPSDIVLTPLPLFHINPLGYALLGALTAGAQFVVAEKFSASGFWPTVVESGATAVVLHGPPLEILKRRTSRADAEGHGLRIVLYADPQFLDQFGIPIGVSVYGSTEGGGLSHAHHWRSTDAEAGHELGAYVGGSPRVGFSHAIDDNGEILIRSSVPGSLASGYVTSDGTLCPVTQDGWYHSGDLGYLDEQGALVFSARASESIRAKGEFVPIQFVEQRFGQLPSVREAAIWKRPGRLRGEDEIVLYLTCDAIPEADVRTLSNSLPSFMRPASVVRLDTIPIDSGVGKVRRRELANAKALEVVDL